MSFDVKVDTTDFENLRDALVVAEIELNGKLVFDELLIIGQRILELARENIPFKTGAARDSLQMIIDESNQTVTIGSDGGIGPDGVRRIYLRYLELGTSKMQARPFLFPAAIQAIEEFRLRVPKKFKDMLHTSLGK